MSDIIYYKNGEETFRISPPTVGTKCPETKLEVKKMNEKEQLKAQIQELQEQLQKLEEKSPVEEAFKRVYNRYPVTDGNDTCWDGSTWVVFQKGYKSAQKDYKVGEYQPTPQKPSMINCIIKGPPPNGYPSWSEWYNEMGSKGILHNLKISSLGEGKFQPTPQTENEVAEGLRSAFREAVEKGVIPKTKELNKEVDSMKENPPEFLKFELGPTLFDVIGDWWDDVFTVQSDDDLETSVQDLCDKIEKWLPKEQSANSQNAYVELTVEGFNDAITKIKNKIKNKLK